MKKAKNQKKIIKETDDNPSPHRRRAKIWHAAVILVIALVFYLLKIANYYPLQDDLTHKSDFFGVTFSTKYASELGLDWREAYQAILDELQVKYIRIPVYWDEIEKEEGKFDFSNYDYLIETGGKQGAEFIISIGRRIPRWPECHSPAWLGHKDISAVQTDTLEMLKIVVEHYRDQANIEYWQVENEAFLGTFGVCPPLDEKFLEQEFNLVRSLDSRPIIITGSGELGFWRREAKIGDVFGSTLYRVVYNNFVGFIKYPFPPAYYRWKAKLADLTPNNLMILELQAEPWVPRGRATNLTVDEINRSMSVRQFRANLQYAINLDFPRAYAWGVEWWYWQKKYGNPEYWRIAETLFK